MLFSELEGEPLGATGAKRVEPPPQQVKRRAFNRFTLERVAARGGRVPFAAAAAAAK